MEIQCNETALKLKWCHIDREVTPFQLLSVRAELRMVMLSQFLKDCKLQNNSSLNVPNQELAPKHKPIAAWHQSVIHWGEWEGIKEQESLWTEIYEACVVIQPVLKAFVEWLVGCMQVLVGWSLEVKGWGLCLCLLAICQLLSAYLSPL